MFFCDARFFVRHLASQGVSAAVLVVGFVSCGGPELGSGPVAYDDFPRAFASAVCDNIGPCCRTEGFAHDSATCHTGTEAGIAESMKGLTAQGVVYDSAAARECLDAYARAARSCGDAKSIEEPCERVFRGTRMNGEPCAGNEQCASRSCRVIADMDVARCAPERVERVHAKKGDACGWTCTVRGNGEGCMGATGSPSDDAGHCYTNDALYCSKMGVCETTPGLGEACSTGTCAHDNFCEGGICTPRRDAGPCSTSDACVVTAFCDESMRECTPKKALGEPCSTVTECQQGLCVRRGGAMQRICGYASIAEARLCSGNR